MAPPPSLEEAVEAATSLHYVMRILHWTGTMPHPRAGTWALLVFHVVSGVIATFLVCFTCSQSALLWQLGASDLNLFTLVISLISTPLTWMIRLVHIAVRKRDFHRLAYQARYDFCEFLSWRDVPILESWSARVRRYVLVVVCLGATGPITWTSSSQSDSGLQFELVLPYDVSKPLAFSITWTVCTIITWHVVVMSLMADAFNVSLISQLRIQLILLSRNIVELSSDVHSTRKSTASMRKDLNADLSDIEFTDLHHRLRKIVHHHQAIISNAALLEECLRGMLLAQSLSIGNVMCIQLFQVAMSADALQQAVKFGTFLLAMFCQIFLYCWFGDDLMSESENVVFAAYDAVTTLDGCSLSIKHSLLILMVRAQRPLRITAAGFFSLSRESLVSILNVSYSFFAVLRGFRDE